MSGSLLRVWVVALAVCLGAAVGASGSHWLRVGIAGSLLCFPLAFARRHPTVILIALGALGFSCGAGAASAQQRTNVLGPVTDQVPECAIEGAVLESLGGLGTALALERIACEGFDVITDAGVAVADLSAHPGSGIQATGWLIPLGDDPFDRARSRAGADVELAISEVAVVAPGGIAAVPAAVREGLARSGEAIPAPEAALVRGLTIGDTDAIAPATLEEFRRAGLSHLLAVSGSNVSIVLGAVMWMSARMAFRHRLCLGAAGLGFFVLVVGPDASVLRAAAMGAVGLVALAWGTRPEPLHALAAAVIAVVAMRPQIVFSLGLHLSVAATAGIILFTPALLDRLGRLPRVVALPIAVTLGAQVAVLPLLVFAFEEASLIAPLANLLAAPAVAPATILGLAGAVLAPLSQTLGEASLHLAAPFASWILFVGRVCSEPGWASMQLPGSVGYLLSMPVVASVWLSLRRRCRGLPSGHEHFPLDASGRPGQ